MSTENSDTGSQNTSQETVTAQSQTEQVSSLEQQGQSSQAAASPEMAKSAEKTETSPTPQAVTNPLEISAVANEDEKSEDAEGEEAAKQDATENAAPENYADFKAPEGVELNGAVVDSFKGVAKKLNLSQEKAQAMIDEIAPVMAAQQVEFIKRVSGQWLEQAKKDPEIGGSNYDSSIQRAIKVRDRFGRMPDGNYDADVAELFSLPVGSHPGFIKLLARVGAAISEDTPPKGKVSGAITPQDIYG
jgi:hypothetical protein